jgi:chromosome partitioning protein
MTKVISFINYKGGVGKTTTAFHVSSSLAQHYGQRVLMIDIDPQTNLTFLCANVDPK